MFRRESAFPIKIDWEFTTPEKLQTESDRRDELYFSNQEVPEDTSDIVYIPYGRTQEFIDRYNDLILYFNRETTLINNELHKKEHSK